MYCIQQQHCGLTFPECAHGTLSIHGVMSISSNHNCGTSLDLLSRGPTHSWNVEQAGGSNDTSWPYEHVTFGVGPEPLQKSVYLVVLCASVLGFRVQIR